MSDFPLASREPAPWPPAPMLPQAFMATGLTLAQVSAILKAWRRMSLLVVLLVLATTAALMTYWPRTYVAMAGLMVNYEVNDPLNGKDLPVGQVSSYIATQVELMQTPEVLLTVVDRLGLAADEDYAKDWRSGNGTLREWVALKVAKSLAVYPSQRGSQLIYVSYAAQTPAQAADVANAVADVYKEQDAHRSEGPPGERSRRYERQLDELKAKVDKAQAELTGFNQRNGLIDEGGEAGVDVASLATLEARLLEARNAREVAELRASQDAASSDQVLMSVQASTLRAQKETQEMRLAQLNRQFMPIHPDVIDARFQLEATQRALSAILKAYTSNTAAALAIARRTEQGLQQAVDDKRAGVLAKSLVQDDAAKYQLALESAQSVYKRLLDGYDQVRFDSVMRASNIQIVSRATPPVRAVKPRLLLGSALGGLLALLLGIGLPLVYELTHRRVRCGDDLERDHGVPVLAEFTRLPVRALT
jgi:polysaccharide biosynthesis transport protein